MSLSEAERRVLGFTDAELGRHWDFPAPLIEAITHHEWAPERIADPRSLAGFIVRARAFARAYGASDGVEPAQGRTEPPSEWLLPPVAPALTVVGGIDGLHERADAFLPNAIQR